MRGGLCLAPRHQRPRRHRSRGRSQGGIGVEAAEQPPEFPRTDHTLVLPFGVRIAARSTAPRSAPAVTDPPRLHVVLYSAGLAMGRPSVVGKYPEQIEGAISATGPDRFVGVGQLREEGRRQAQVRQRGVGGTSCDRDHTWLACTSGRSRIPCAHSNATAGERSSSIITRPSQPATSAKVPTSPLLPATHRAEHFRPPVCATVSGWANAVSDATACARTGSSDCSDDSEQGGSAVELEHRQRRQGHASRVIQPALIRHRKTMYRKVEHGRGLIAAGTNQCSTTATAGTRIRCTPNSQSHCAPRHSYAQAPEQRDCPPYRRCLVDQPGASQPGIRSDNPSRLS